jgi:hypothetical protein
MIFANRASLGGREHKPGHDNPERQVTALGPERPSPRGSF